MILSSTEAVSKLENRTSRSAVAEALVWQNHLRFHGLTVKDKSMSVHWPRFQEWVNQRLWTIDTRKAFEATFQFPVVTNKLLAEVHDGWMKLFDSVNAYLKINGKDGVETDMLEYLKTSGEADWWQNKAIATLIESVNDFIVIDVKPSTTGKFEPYFSLCSLDSLIDIGEIDDNGVPDYIAYRTTTNQVAFLDGGFYRLYDPSGDGYTLVSENPHKLGYCPARLFWNERVPGHKVAVVSPVDEVLPLLDRYAYRDTTVEIFKDMGVWPITWGIESTEEEQPRGNGTYAVDDAGNTRECTDNSSGKPAAYLALGQYKEIPMNAFGQGFDPRPPVGIVSPDIDAAKFNTEALTELATNIVQYLCGVGGGSLINKQAVNKEQAGGMFAGMENSLRYISRHTSATRSWVINTMGRLRHESRWVGCDHSFGTEWYLKSDADQLADIKTARDGGLPPTLIIQMVEAYQQYRLRTAPGQAPRTRIMADLDPHWPLSVTDCLGYMKDGLVTRQSVAVKIQLQGLISQFEREWDTDIAEWGNLMPYQSRIEKINDYLYQNVRLEEPKPVNPASGSAGFPGGSTGAVEPVGANQ